jgi:endogenous inhibitor of DNA gyrase (YacG/DUF329 family)
MNIQCPICKKKFKQITVQHIRTHNLTINQFKTQYPNTDIVNRNAILRSKELAKQRAIIDNIHCKQCDKLIISPYRKHSSFCSSSCAAIHNNKKRTKLSFTCPICGTIFNKRYHSGFCSTKCLNISKYNEFIKKWLNKEISGSYNGNDHSVNLKIKRFLFEKFNHKCQKCGWDKINTFTNKIPLTIHHIDGDCTNSFLDNLELLCPNCHSLTEQYGSRNKGKSKRNYKRILLS